MNTPLQAALHAALQAALQAAPLVDADHPAVIAFAQQAAAGARDDRERAVRLY